jgi:hypothetical protein
MVLQAEGLLIWYSQDRSHDPIQIQGFFSRDGGAEVIKGLRRDTWRVALLAISVTLAALWFSAPAAHSTQGSVDLVAVDLNTTGNTDSLIGGIQPCGSMATVGSTLTFDLIVRGVDGGDRIKGYQVDIDYNPSILSVVSILAVDGTPSSILANGNVSVISRIDSHGGFDFLNLSSTAVSGSLTAAAADATNIPAPPANHETGEGVLARITVQGIAAGTSPLTIAGPIGGQDGVPDTIVTAGTGPLVNTGIPVDTVQSGSVVVAGSCPTYLTVAKTVDNTGGGTATQSAFTARINGGVVPFGIAQNIGPGTHTVTEDPSAAYTPSFGGACDASGQVTLIEGDSKVCVITNTFVPPKITITKVVNNTGGGTATADSFTYRLDGGIVLRDVATTVTPGTHTVSEDSPAPAYTVTYGGACAANGTVTVAGGDNKTCTITNTFVPPTITVNKVVDNSDGGSLTPDDFTLRVDGSPVTRGVPVQVLPGAHVVSEDPASLYVGSIGGACAGNGSISVTGGQNAVCTITNTFSPTSNIVIGSASARHGETVSVSLLALGIPSIGTSAATVEISFDEAEFTPTVCNPDPAGVLDIAVCNLTYAPGVIRFSALDNTGASGDLTLATIDFSGLGESSLGLTVVTYTDSGGAPLPHTTQNGALFIGPDPGDVDCDNDVDVVDALFVLQSVVGTRTEATVCPPPVGTLYLPPGDVDDDTDVDAVDALFILRCVAGYVTVLCPAGALPTINGGNWNFADGSTGNVVQISLEDTPATGLAQADISVTFDPAVLAVVSCDSGDLTGACTANAPTGPSRAAGIASPALTGDPVALSNLVFNCIGPAGSSTELTITVHSLTDGASQTISSLTQHGHVTCGPAIAGGEWQFAAGSVGNQVDILFLNPTASGLGSANFTVSFQSPVIKVTTCAVGGLLTGSCTPNAPNGPVVVSASAAPPILSGPIVLASINFNCVGSVGTHSDLIIQVTSILDGSALPVSAAIQAGDVKCG